MNKSILSYCCVFGVLISISMVFGCQGKTPEQLESEAGALRQEADGLWKIGQEKQAFPLYDKIAEEYPETVVAKDLESALKFKNLVFGSTAASWTNMKLFEIENLVVEIFAETGEYSEAMETGLDGWNNRIIYKVFGKQKADFDFMVISAGPDGKLDTPDDLRLVHARNKRVAGSGGLAPKFQGGGASEVAIDKINSALGLAGKELEEQDREISMQDIEKAMGSKKQTKGQMGSEMEIDLDDLLQGNIYMKGD